MVARPLQPVSLTLDLIRAFFKPGGTLEYEVPLSESISHTMFERIDGEGYGDCGPIGIQNSLNIQQGKETSHKFDYNSILKPLKQKVCDIMIQYVLNCSNEELSKLKEKTTFARGTVSKYYACLQSA